MKVSLLHSMSRGELCKLARKLHARTLSEPLSFVVLAIGNFDGDLNPKRWQPMQLFLSGFNPLVPRQGYKNKNPPKSFNWLLLASFTGLICEGNSRFWHNVSLGTYGLKRSALAAWNICFLKTINYIEVQKYLFGINGLILRIATHVSKFRTE